jgi:hypothetical protein
MRSKHGAPTIDRWNEYDHTHHQVNLRRRTQDKRERRPCPRAAPRFSSPSHFGRVPSPWRPLAQRRSERRCPRPRRTIPAGKPRRCTVPPPPAGPGGRFSRPHHPGSDWMREDRWPVSPRAFPGHDQGNPCPSWVPDAGWCGSAIASHRHRWQRSVGLSLAPRLGSLGTDVRLVIDNCYAFGIVTEASPGRSPVGTHGLPVLLNEFTFGQRRWCRRTSWIGDQN